MGYADRDYYRSRQPGAPGTPGGPGASSGTGLGLRFTGRSIVFWLIVLNVAVFLLDRMLGRAAPTLPELRNLPLENWGHFSATTAILHFQVWRFVTFQFLHFNPEHLFFNMFALYLFGPMVESYLGRRRFLVFYLGCGMAGAVSYLLFWAGHVILSGPNVPLVGASAGIFGVLIAAARIVPDARVLLFFIIPMKLRTLAWVAVGIGAYTVVFRGYSPGANAGGEAAHLGGAALAYILMQRPHLLNLLTFGGHGGVLRVYKPRKSSWFSKLTPHRRPHDDAEVDRILQKVRDQGLASLNDRERRTLQQATERQRHAG